MADRIALIIVIGSLLALALSWAGVARFRHWAERHRILDLPNDRSLHLRPTPRGGGLLIAGVCLVVGPLFTAISGAAIAWQQWLPCAFGAAIVAAVSWWDDLRSLPQWVRLAAQTWGACCAVAGLGFWRSVSLPALGSIDLGWGGLILTILWIVFQTNAYNFMDGVDGLAAGQAVTAALGWSILGVAMGDTLLCSLGSIVAASSLGFLLHNWPPARIFMGDVGSAFLGYTFAVFPLMLSFSVSNYDWRAAPLLGAFFVWPFVFDSAFTLMRRLFKGENIFSAHRSHLYQRLVRVGWGHRTISLTYIGLALAGVLLARAWSSGATTPSTSAVLVVLSLCLGLWVGVIHQERRYESRSHAGLPTLVDPS